MADSPHDLGGDADRSDGSTAALERFVVVRDDATLQGVRSPAHAGERRAPVLFVHGYPDTHATWSLQLEGLAPMHPVAALDQRGVGGSTRPTGREGLAIARYLEDIEAAIDALAGPEGQVHLVGHDWGGVLAWLFAERYPDRLRSLAVLAGPHPGMTSQRLVRWATRPSLQNLGRLLDQARRSWYIAFFQLPRVPEWYLGRQWPQGYVAALRAGGVPKDDPILRDLDEAAVRSAAITPLALYRQIPRLQAPPRVITVPTCLIVPVHDFALRPELYDTVPEYVPDLEVHALDANHWAHRQRPQEVNAILHGFFGRHEPA